MAKIVFYLPANATHSFLLGNRWDAMFNDQLGLHQIGRSRIPVTTSHQGIEYELYPFLRNVLDLYPSIETAFAPYGHSLLNIMPSKHVAWECKHGVGNLPVTFFGEFAVPHYITTEFFFLLKEQTCSYSITVGGNDEYLGLEVDSPIPNGVESVRFGNHTGIVLDGYQGFLKAWFNFAAKPHAEVLSVLMDEVKKMAEDPRSVIVVPLDLEQPYVGSAIGASLWEIFFQGLKDASLAHHITPLSSILDDLRSQASRSIKKPSRIMQKWTVHEAQIRYRDSLMSLNPVTQKDRMRFSLASSSDALSSMNRMVLESLRDPIRFTVEDSDRKEKVMEQGPNLPLQQACSMARDVIIHGDITLSQKLESIEGPNGLIKALHRWAVNHDL